MIYAAQPVPYDFTVVSQAIADGLKARGRGSQTELANALGLRVQTVNKWAQGQTAPDMKRWEDIERFFGWQPGYLGEMANTRPASPSGVTYTFTAEQVEALFNRVHGVVARLDSLVARQEALEATVAELIQLAGAVGAGEDAPPPARRRR